MERLGGDLGGQGGQDKLVVGILKYVGTCGIRAQMKALLCSRRKNLLCIKWREGTARRSKDW